jgi:hypothetical protein
MLAREQEGDFEQLGYVRLPEAIDGSVVSELTEYAWSLLASHGIRRDEPETWRRPRPKGIQSLARSGELNPICSNKVRGAIDELLGSGGWQEPENWGQLLISLPTDGEWRLPHNTWHVDLPQRATGRRVPGVQVFACLERLLPRGGATVAVTGSHRLVGSTLSELDLSRSGGSAKLRSELSRKYSWFRQLWSANTDSDRERLFMAAPTRVDGVPVQVVELTGEPGDVILTHCYLFHAASPNIRPHPRIAVTQRLAAV